MSRRKTLHDNSKSLFNEEKERRLMSRIEGMSLTMIVIMALTMLMGTLRIWFLLGGYCVALAYYIIRFYIRIKQYPAEMEALISRYKP